MESKKKRGPEGRKAGAYRGGYWLAVFVALIGLGGSFYLWNTKQRSEAAGLAVAFRVESDNVIVSIRRELNQYFDVLESVGHLHSLSPDVSADVFNEFVQKGMLYQQRILGVFGLAPRIDGPDRAPYEAAMRRQVRPDFSLVEWTEDGWAPASRQELYFPVSYLAPDMFQDIPVGYDLHSDADNARAMLEAVQGGHGRAGGLVRGKRGAGRILFSPIQHLMPGLLNGKASGGYAFGYAFAVMYPAEVIDRILRNHTPEGLDVEVLEGKGQNVIRLYPPESKNPVSTNGSLHVEQTLQINGLNWRVVCRASRAFIEQRKTRVPWIYLAGGLLLTLVVAGQIAQLAGRTARIRRLVAERTDELEQANRELEREIRQRHELQRQIIDISTQEKKRVGRDLHDSLGQQLTGIGLLTSALAKRLDQTQQEEGAWQA
ncbi:MAG: CHASE domain-containing protein, partial [Kiritimatiellae bacterium]|nr:CHASE domain-containing protein [Kiritimatiellia bacterium]